MTVLFAKQPCNSPLPQHACDDQQHRKGLGNRVKPLANPLAMGMGEGADDLPGVTLEASGSKLLFAVSLKPDTVLSSLSRFAHTLSPRPCLTTPTRLSKSLEWRTGPSISQWVLIVTSGRGITSRCTGWDSSILVCWTCSLKTRVCLSLAAMTTAAPVCGISTILT